MNTISSLETTDLPAAYHIEQRAHAFPWSEKTFASNQGERYLNFQLTQNGKMAAFAITQVVLDEATAFTDPENEAVIQASIAGLVAGKTLIVIAHRLSTITKADKILVVEKGNVAAEGTHEELLETSDLYKELWKAHMQGRDTAEEVA